MVYVIAPSSAKRTVWNSLLAAGVIASVCMLGACADKPEVEANKAAMQKADEAARKEASAGDARPTQHVIRSVISDEEYKKLQAEIKKGFSKPDDWKTYLTQKTISEDLSDVNTILRDALAGGGGEKVPTAPVKSLVQLEVGNSASLQAQLDVQQLDAYLTDLLSEASAIDSLTRKIALLDSTIKLADARAKGIDLAKALADAKEASSKAKEDAEKTAQVAESTKNELNAKKAQAQQLYDKAAQDEQVASRAQGEASIEPYKQAMAIRSQAHALTEEVANLQPRLLQAQGDAEAAKIKASETAELEKALASVAQEGADQTKNAADEAATARAAAKKLVDEPTTGLAAHAKNFDNLAAKISELMTHTAKDATTASNAYDAAAKELIKSQREIIESKEKDNLKPDDPRLVVASDRRAEALIIINQATAQYRGGMAYLIGYVTAQTQDFVSTAVGKAYATGGAAGATPPAKLEQKDTDARKADAVKALSAALTTLDNAGKVTGQNIPENSPIRWLASSLKAVSFHARFLANGDPADKTNAEDAATKARTANPNLQLMVAAQAQP